MVGEQKNRQRCIEHFPPENAGISAGSVHEKVELTRSERTLRDSHTGGHDGLCGRKV